MLRGALLLLLPLLLSATPPPAGAPRDLSFEERIAAQAAIERVYHSHQIGTTRSFEEAVPRAILERKVRTYLEQSAALDLYAKTPVTAEMLGAELDRIASRTLLPSRLLEIYGALGNDAFLVQECFVRPVLVDRLARSFAQPTNSSPGRSAFGAAAGRSRAPRWSAIGPERIAAVRAVADPIRDLPAPRLEAAATESGPPCLTGETWDNGILGEAPDPRRMHTAVWTGSEMILWGGDYSDEGQRYDPLTDSWRRVSRTGAPEGRRNHQAVWTGSEMIVWGGRIANGGLSTDTGGRYDPVTDTWTPTTLSGAPPPAAHHTAVWTGAEMLVWGGYDYATGTYLDTGGRYDPQTDGWSPVSPIGAPPGRVNHSATWTGSEMVVWGGNGPGTLENTGARYDPATDTWAPVSSLGAPAVAEHADVWTGSEVIVWQGRPLRGGRYDPATDTWMPLSLAGAPFTYSQRAVWTGSEMLVWGNDSGLKGARYDPALDSWSPIPSAGEPERRSFFSAVWTGDLLIIWGGHGSDSGTVVNTGGRYDPAANAWTPTSIGGGPRPAWHATAVWTGTAMVVWGGANDPFPSYPSDAFQSGAKYDPLVDAWTPTSTIGAPAPRYDHTAIWTGDEMLVWGGDDTASFLSSGGRYDPVTDTWAAVSTTGAPSGRTRHTAVWSGTEMIVWGGEDGSGSTATGGRYDPAADAWLPTQPAGAPAQRFDHAGVWTGTRMVVWGGRSDSSTYLDTGGRYDPTTNTWMATNVNQAPLERWSPLAFWTGSRMIVWGGRGHVAALDDGKRYDPVGDIWQGMANPGAPTGSLDYAGAWTGSEMIVWGGEDFPEGARYDPAANAWSPVTPTDAPDGRQGHVAVWTGDFLLTWGGARDSVALNSGGRYFLGDALDLDDDGFGCDVDCDDLDPATFPGAAEACDGIDNDCDGAVPASEQDADGDTWAACAECDDGNAARFPGNPEICDALDNDCDGVADGFATTCGLGQCASAGVCAGGTDSCVPGPPSAETCDGIDNDCDGALPAGEADADADGFPACAECDDAEADVFPGAPEINDGIDNQCPGEDGYGLADEIQGTVAFTTQTELCWPAQPGAGSYEVLASALPDLAAACDRSRTDAVCADLPALPLPGGVDYLQVRALAPHQGSAGADSEGLERIGLCGVEFDCADGFDDDGDGLTDCDDVADCFGAGGCETVTLTFVDGFTDDATPSALLDFFAPLPAIDTDWLYLTLGGATIDYELCLARADWYRDTYLALESGEGMATSGAWDRWVRQAGGPWTGPDPTSRDNWYGGSCLGAGSWCAEFLLGGHGPVLDPAAPAECEAYDILGCETPMTFTLRAGADRLSACGF